MYVSFSDINTKEKREALYHKMEIAQDVIDDFVDNYCSKENIDVLLANVNKKMLK